MYNLIVIGAGPGGYHTAIRAAQKGLKVAIIEKDKVGGVCLNRGCIPTKALYATAHKLIDIDHSKDFGIDIDKFSFDFSIAQERKDKIVSQMVLAVEELFKKHKIDLFIGEAEFISKSIIKVNDDTLETENIIIATGSSPLMLPFFNIDHEVILDSTDLLNLKELPKSLIILGAGVMGVEFATIFNAFGVDVTVLELEKQILPLVEKRVSSRMAKILKNRGVKLELRKRTELIKNDNGEAYFKLDNGSEFRAEKALISIGRKFNSNIKGLDKIGIELDSKGAIIVDYNQKTNIDNIFAIGDVVGGMLLAHVASYEGERALFYIENGKTYPKKTVPSAIFSIPEIAIVGKSDKSLKKGVFSYLANGKALALGEKEGTAIIYADDNNIIKGATIMGADASNLIQLITLAIDNKMELHHFSKTIFPHPTLSEIILEATEDIDGVAIHKFSK